MKSDLIRIAAVAAMATLASTAAADHNSKWGEGWAKMPNDIHNVRVETQGDDETFREFVKKGAGADSENRFDTDDAKGARSETKAKTREQTAATTETKSRERSRARAELRRNERSAAATRSHTRSMRGNRGRGRR